MLNLKHILLICIIALIYVITFYILAKYNTTIRDTAVAKIMYIDGRLLIKRKNFNYAEIYKRLKSHGFSENFKKPVYYFSIRVGVGLIFGLVLALLNPLLIILGFIIGYLGFKWYEEQKNTNDNEKMRADIMMLYNILATQLKGGLYVSDALIECRSLIKNERLKRAFDEFKIHAEIDDYTLLENLDELESKFDNESISSLCMAIRQSETSGKVQDLIKDLIKQMHDFEEIRFQELKSKMDRELTIFALVLFADIMFYVIFVFVTRIMEMI